MLSSYPGLLSLSRKCWVLWTDGSRRFNSVKWCWEHNWGSIPHTSWGENLWPGGEIGRRRRLKISRTYVRAGSIPALAKRRILMPYRNPTYTPIKKTKPPLFCCSEIADLWFAIILNSLFTILCTLFWVVCQEFCVFSFLAIFSFAVSLISRYFYYQIRLSYKMDSTPFPPNFLEERIS